MASDDHESSLVSRVIWVARETSVFARGIRRMHAHDYVGAIGFLTQLQSDGHPHLKLVLGMLAYCHTMTGRVKEAEHCIGRLLAMAEKGDDHFIAYADHLRAIVQLDDEAITLTAARFSSVVPTGLEKRNLVLLRPKQNRDSA